MNWKEYLTEAKDEFALNKKTSKTYLDWFKKLNKKVGITSKAIALVDGNSMEATYSSDIDYKKILKVKDMLTSMVLPSSLKAIAKQSDANNKVHRISIVNQ